MLLCLFVSLGFSSLSAHLGLYRTREKHVTGSQCPALFHEGLGFFYMHYDIDMMIHATAFDKPVGSTGWKGRRHNIEDIPPFSSMGDHEFVSTGIRTRDLQHT